VDALAGVAVISRDPAVRALAAAQGAQPLVERGYDLNAALEQARAAVVAAGAAAVLVLPADLPLLTAEDLAGLCAQAQLGDGVVIAPSHDGGTNALLLRPPLALPYAFGVDSFARHCALAAAAGLPCRVYRSPTLAWDVDTPEDLLVTRR
jgi:2-phospho-L-lactate guanylyltransferase